MFVYSIHLGPVYLGGTMDRSLARLHRPANTFLPIDREIDILACPLLYSRYSKWHSQKKGADEKEDRPDGTARWADFICLTAHGQCCRCNQL